MILIYNINSDLYKLCAFFFDIFCRILNRRCFKIKQ